MRAWSGGVAERLIAPVLKTGRPKGLVGSNPTPSAIQFAIFDVRFVDEASTRQGSRKEFLKSLRKPRPINNVRRRTCARSQSKLGSADTRGRSASSRAVARRKMPRKQPCDRMEMRDNSN